MEYGHEPAGMSSVGGAASAVMAAVRWKGKRGVKGGGGDGPGGGTIGEEENEEEESVVALSRRVKGMMGGGGGGGGGGSDGASGEGRIEEEDDPAVATELAALADLAGALDVVGEGDGTLSGALAARIVGMRAGEIVAAAERFSGEIVVAGPAGKLLVLERQVAAITAELVAEEDAADAARALASAAEHEALAAANNLEAVRAHNSRCVEETRRLHAMVVDPTHAADVARLMVLVKKHGEVKAGEHTFKAACKRSMREMQRTLAATAEGPSCAAPGALDTGMLPTSSPSPEEEEHMRDIQATFIKEERKHTSARGAVAKRTRAVQLLARKLDDIPTRAELVQYERRFAELYGAVQSKLSETRRHFDAFNVLADTRRFLAKEISLLNSLQEQVTEAVASPEGRASLVSSLRGNCETL
jgi:hypothetical protein